VDSFFFFEERACHVTCKRLLDEKTFKDLSIKEYLLEYSIYKVLILTLTNIKPIIFFILFYFYQHGLLSSENAHEISFLSVMHFLYMYFFFFIIIKSKPKSIYNRVICAASSFMIQPTKRRLNWVYFFPLRL
jgi:hypothetical protein